MSPTRAFIVLLLGAMALAGCNTEASNPGTPLPASASASASAGLRHVNLLLSYRPDVQFAPFYLAQQRGYFADAGLEVSIEHRDGSDLIRLVADGQADIGVADATDVMISRTSGIPITYVSALYAHFPVGLVGSPDTVPADPAGLAGLRIGTPGRFGSSWAALLAVLDAGGLAPDDVTIREYPAFNQVEGLLNGDVDLITGFLVNEPLQMEGQGRAVAVMSVDDIAPLPGPGFVVGDEILGGDEEMLRSFIDAVGKAVNDIAADVDAGVDAAVQEVPAIGEDRETARAVLSASVRLWLDDQGVATFGVDRDLWQTGYATMRRLGLIDGSVAADEMYRDIFAQRLGG